MGGHPVLSSVTGWMFGKKSSSVPVGRSEHDGAVGGCCIQSGAPHRSDLCVGQHLGDWCPSCGVLVGNRVVSVVPQLRRLLVSPNWSCGLGIRSTSEG